MVEGRMPKAESLLQKYHQMNPSDSKVLIDLGDVYSYKKDWDQAIENYKKAVTLEPKNPEYLFKLGGAYGMKALLVSKLEALLYIPDIKKNLEMSARIDPNQVESRRALVELYVQLPGIIGGSTKKAAEYARQLESISPINAFLAKGYIAKYNDEKLNSLQCYKKAFSSYSSSSEEVSNSINYQLGEISAEEHINLQQGLQLLEKYIQNYSYKDIYSLEWAYFRKAQLYLYLNEKQSAERAIDKALSLKGDFKEAVKIKRRIQSR
ncbi:MAG: tetratricopeptide repeat protein [Gillisia sp.]